MNSLAFLPQKVLRTSWGPRFGSLAWGKPSFPHAPPSFNELGRRGAVGGAPAEQLVSKA